MTKQLFGTDGIRGVPGEVPLDDATLERVTDVFANELANTGLINIGRAAQARDPFFSRVLHLVKSAGKA